MLVIDELTVRIAGRPLLESASARIPTGARVGLVGRNGTGKSTLLQLIPGEVGRAKPRRPFRRAGASARLAQEAPTARKA